MRARAHGRSKPRERVARVELIGELDAHAAEAFVLEVRRLAARHARVRVVASTQSRRSRLA